jgi:hypothetical protein
MTEAKRDQNHVPTLLAASDADGITTLPVSAIAGSHRLCIQDALDGSDLSDEPGQRDQNRVVVLMAVSATDGVTPVPIYATEVGNKLKVRSN